jgi:sorting nexin-29
MTRVACLDLLECPNYRGITLLNTAYKVFSNILYTRLKTYAEKIIGSYQCSFREGKSTIDQLQALRQILEKTREHKISIFHLFIDYKAAYDRIRRDKLLSAMEEFEIPNKPINLIRATLKRVRYRVKIQKDQTHSSLRED